VAYSVDSGRVAVIDRSKVFKIPIHVSDELCTAGLILLHVPALIEIEIQYELPV
jgi:hypothetical protein